ncbi:MAG: hypothetical protein WEB50_11495 [Vicinamibacterales bacterium]
MRKLLLCLVVPALLALPAHASAGELKLSINGGLVTLVAQDVPLSMIMAEWARIGQTRIVNGDKILTPVSLQLVNVPERKALDILLRSASGYMLAERPTPMANASAFDRILILPTSKPPAYTGPANPVPAPFTPPPRPIQVQPMPDMDMQPEVNPDAPPPLPPGMQPGMQPQMPIQPGQPGGPLTAPRPGQLPAPVPQQPVPFGAPPRPPGSGGRGGGPGGR